MCEECINHPEMCEHCAVELQDFPEWEEKEEEEWLDPHTPELGGEG